MVYSELKANGANDERRTISKTICFAPQELQLVVQRARAAGRPPSRFIRELSLGASPRPRRAHLSNPIINMLSQIALRLTQLAIDAKDHDLALAAEFEEAVSKALDIIRQLE